MRLIRRDGGAGRATLPPMSSESDRKGLLAEYLESAREEQAAWSALAACDQAVEDCSQAFLRWKRASRASEAIELRWRAALRRDSPEA